jgi:hypothetical protein
MVLQNFQESIGQPAQIQNLLISIVASISQLETKTEENRMSMEKNFRNLRNDMEEKMDQMSRKMEKLREENWHLLE